MKLCKDCEHFGSNYYCYRKREVEPIIGQPIPLSPTTERYSILPWKCGKNARYFKLKSESGVSA